MLESPFQDQLREMVAWRTSPSHLSSSTMWSETNQRTKWTLMVMLHHRVTSGGTLSKWIVFIQHSALIYFPFSLQGSFFFFLPIKNTGKETQNSNGPLMWMYLLSWQCFLFQVDKILKVIPRERRTFLFSATMTKKVGKNFSAITLYSCTFQVIYDDIPLILSLSD